MNLDGGRRDHHARIRRDQLLEVGNTQFFFDQHGKPEGSGLEPCVKVWVLKRFFGSVSHRLQNGIILRSCAWNDDAIQHRRFRFSDAVRMASGKRRADVGEFACFMAITSRLVPTAEP